MANLKLKTPSSGSVTFTSNDTASDLTVTFPAATGTAMVSGNMPTFGAYRSSDQSITTNTWTKVQLNTEEWDTANCFDSTTNYRFTPTVAGYYQINGGFYAGASGTITRIIIGIYKNGSIYKLGNYMAPATADSLRGVAVVSSVVYFNGTTDYVELYGYITGTGPVFAGDSAQVYMNGFLARAA